jgi:choline dehydrogenase
MPADERTRNVHDAYDYVIVGAGSAGCVLAARLTEDPAVRVLLVEAGPKDPLLNTRIPLLVGRILSDDRYLWRAATEPEPELYGNRVDWPSGRVLGGSSSVNGMVFVRGHPKRYDEWAAAGCPGWSFDDALPYFRRLEDCSFGEAALRGRDGPIGVTKLQADAVTASFLASCNAVGIANTDDYNDRAAEGASTLQLSTRNGFRCSAASAYLRPAARRPNLRVINDALVMRVTFDDVRATGVEYVQGGERRVAAAHAEVLLCAGAIRSPQLLELSGIGDSMVVRALGLRVVRHLPAVGENLQDHLMPRIAFECREPVTVNDLVRDRWRLVPAALRYVLKRDGLFATPSLMALAYVRTRPGLPYADARLQFSLMSSVSRVSKDRDSGLDPHSGFHLGGYGIYPESRGRLHAQSTDPSISPRIEAHYLSTAGDREVALAVMKLLRRIAAQPPLQEHIVREVRPGPSTRSDEELLDYVRRTGQTCWHPTGTCRMGSDEQAVVDTELRVRGVQRLRVVDCSVFPFIVASNTNVPVLMLAEKAADLIRQGVRRCRAQPEPAAA